MSWDYNLHRLAVLTCRVPTCTSPSCIFLPQVVVQVSKGGILSPDPRSAPGDTSPFLLPWFRAAVVLAAFWAGGKEGPCGCSTLSLAWKGWELESALFTTGVWQGQGWEESPMLSAGAEFPEYLDALWGEAGAGPRPVLELCPG